MTAETPRAGDGKAGEAAVAGDLATKRCQAHVPVRSGSPTGRGRLAGSALRGLGLESWASSDRTGAGRGSWCQDGSGVDEPSEVGGKAGSGCTVDDVVVDGDGEVENVVDDDLIIDSRGVCSARRRRPRERPVSAGRWRILHRRRTCQPQSPARCRWRDAPVERLITAYIAGNRPGTRAAVGQPAQHASGAGGVEVRLDRPSSALMSATLRRSASRTTCTNPNDPCTVATSTRV